MRRLAYVLSVLSLTSLLAAPCYAGCRVVRRAAVVHEAVVQHAVVAEVTPVAVAVPVPVALFQYVQTSYVPAAPAIASNAVAASQAYPTCQSAVQQQSTLMTDDQVRLLARELASVLKGQDVPVQPKDAKPAAKPQAQAPPPNQQQQLVLTYQAAAVAASRCMECHTGANAKGKAQLFNDQGEFDPKVSFKQMAEAVTRVQDPMPKGMAPLTAAEREPFVKLAAAGQ